MKSKAMLKLIKTTGFGVLAINAITPGALTTEELILDITMICTVLAIVVFNKPINKAASKIPFIEDIEECVMECCQKEEDESENISECTCNNKQEEGDNNDCV